MKELKELIKQLSAEQTELKAKRKTGSNPGWEKRQASNEAASDVRRNKPRITAAIDLYHELRGSTYRHNQPDDWDWRYWYKKDLAALREEFNHDAGGGEPASTEVSRFESGAG